MEAFCGSSRTVLLTQDEDWATFIRVLLVEVSAHFLDREFQRNFYLLLVQLPWNEAVIALCKMLYKLLKSLDWFMESIAGVQYPQHLSKEVVRSTLWCKVCSSWVHVWQILFRWSWTIPTKIDLQPCLLYKTNVFEFSSILLISYY